MTRAQRIELSRQEFVNTLSAGIWFENILNQALLRKMMHQDPTARATHYELTELGDETRHMVMFGKAIERVGAKPVRPKLYQRMIINALPLAFRGSLLWVAALVGEEIFDSLQRQMMDDDELQPMVQRLMRIHVTEEARHIQFARDGLRKRAPHMRRINKMWVANLNGVGGYFFRYLFTNRVPYRRAGLDAREARRVARNSPHRHEVQVIGLRSAGGVPRRGWADGPDRAPDVETHRIPPAMNAKVFDAIVIGGRSVGVTLSDVMLLRSDEVVGSVFDETGHTWMLQTRAGDSYRAQRRHRLRRSAFEGGHAAIPRGCRARNSELLLRERPRRTWAAAVHRGVPERHGQYP